MTTYRIASVTGSDLITLAATPATGTYTVLSETTGVVFATAVDFSAAVGAFSAVAFNNGATLPAVAAAVAAAPAAAVAAAQWTAPAVPAPAAAVAPSGLSLSPVRARVRGLDGTVTRTVRRLSATVGVAEIHGGSRSVTLGADGVWALS